MSAKSILIKYCGGCNPRYDRVAFLDNVKMKLSNFEYIIASSGKSQEADHLIVLCGCPAACPDYSGLVGTRTTHIVYDNSQFDEVIKEITETYYT